MPRTAPPRPDDPFAASGPAPLPRPTLLARDAVAPMPRLALWAFALAYLLPGLVGRDPWRGPDLEAFARMLALAEGRVAWTAPTLGGVAADAAWLPHWLGAVAIRGLGPWVGEALAARLPFAALLAAALAATWYAAYHLARDPVAQPLPLAFGGDPSPVDYARTIGDCALLALIATLGLLQPGHETTPELAQLAALAGWQWALARGRGLPAKLGALLLLPLLAACGAPVIALVCGGLVLALWPRLGRDTAAARAETQPTSVRGGLYDAPDTGWDRTGGGLDGDDPAARHAATDAKSGRADGPLRPWVGAGVVLAAVVAWPMHTWAWRAAAAPEPLALARQWLWFAWPAWLLAAWTLWRWRHHLGERHLALPLALAAVTVAASVTMGGSARALMLGLPSLAVLAAFALPALRRSASAAIDWFSVVGFTVAAALVWMFFVAMHTGVPARPAANVAKLAPGFVARVVPLEIAAAALATLAWGWLVRWRTKRHRAPVWKSLVLPAGGVALVWLLVMTLWLPLLDYARSNRPLVERLAPLLAPGECVAAPGAPGALVAALEVHGRRRVDAAAGALAGPCPLLLLVQRGAAPPPLLADAQRAGWAEVGRVRRPTERNEWTIALRRR